MSEFVAACRIDEIAIGTAKRVMVESVPIAVVRTAEGVFAIKDVCSHADVELSEGEVEGCTIECWLHGSAFDLKTGAPLSLPAIRAVPIYEVRVVGDGSDAVIEVATQPINVSTPIDSH
jgi:3-phenylpropionate/trans-cinnamate dioxygenase ferredoxin subunit